MIFSPISWHSNKHPPSTIKTIESSDPGMRVNRSQFLPTDIGECWFPPRILGKTPYIPHGHRSLQNMVGWPSNSLFRTFSSSSSSSSSSSTTTTTTTTTSSSITTTSWWIQLYLRLLLFAAISKRPSHFGLETQEIRRLDFQPTEAKAANTAWNSRLKTTFFLKRTHLDTVDGRNPAPPGMVKTL